MSGLLIALLVSLAVNGAFIAVLVWREKTNSNIIHDLTLKLITRSSEEYLQAKNFELELEKSKSEKLVLPKESEPTLPEGMEELENVSDDDFLKAINKA